MTLSEQVNEPILSPDGRWIAYAKLEPGAYDDAEWSIWVIPSSGGEPVRLTDRHHSDKFPKWFPDSRRIVFASDRNGNGDYRFHPWTVAIDSATGEPTAPRQLGIEQLAAPANVMDVSPDGRLLAYAYQAVEGKPIELRIIPVEGGRSRIVGTVQDRILQVKWRADAASLLLVQRTADGTRSISEIGLSGGSEMIWTGQRQIRIAADGESFLRKTADSGSDGESGWSLIRVEDMAEIGELRIPSGHSVDELGSSGKVTTVLSDVEASLTIRSLSGGPARRLIDDGHYHRVWDWSPDGTHILVYTDDEGLLTVSAATGERRALPVNARARFSAMENQILTYSHEEFRRLVRLNIVTGVESGLTDSLPLIHEYSSDLVGRGGYELRDGRRDIFLVAHSRTDSVLVMASTGTQVDTLASLRRDELTSPIAVFDSIVAYVVGKSTGPVLEVRAVGESVEPIEVPLPSDYIVQDMAWSHGGNMLAIVSTTDRDLVVRFADRLGPDVRLGSEHRIRASDVLGTLWRFDDSGIVMLPMGLDGSYDTSLLFVPKSPTESIVEITGDERGAIYYFSVSPVADEVAYMTETSSGSSIWLFQNLRFSQ